MAIPQENDSSGSVVQESLKFAARVDADADAANLAPGLFARRQELKDKMRARQDAQDAVFIADGKVAATEALTDRELAAFGKRLAGRLVTARLAGEKHPLYRRVFDGKTPSVLLPGAREDRSTALRSLKTRIEDTETPADVRKDGRDLVKAITTELAAEEARKRPVAAFLKTQQAEEKAKSAVVVAARKLSGDVQSRFAEDPARVRGLLGKGTSGRKGAKGRARKGDGVGETPAEPTANAPG